MNSKREYYISLFKMHESASESAENASQRRQHRSNEEKEEEEEQRVVRKRDEFDQKDFMILNENVSKRAREGDANKARALEIDAFMTSSLMRLEALRQFGRGLCVVKVCNAINVCEIPMKCFEHCRESLRELWVCECKVKGALEGLRGLKNLEFLALYGNEIEDLSVFRDVIYDDDDDDDDDDINNNNEPPLLKKARGTFLKIRRLLLSNNKISKIGNCFENLKALESVDLSENMLTGEEWISSSTTTTTRQSEEEKKEKNSFTEWFRRIKTLNLAANPIVNEAVIHVIAEKATWLEDVRFRDDISGACPIASGSVIAEVLTESTAEKHRYASKCVAAFKESLKYLDGYELTFAIRNKLLELHDKRRATFSSHNENDDQCENIRDADITPIFLDERATIIDSRREVLFAQQQQQNESEHGIVGYRVVVENNAAIAYKAPNECTSVHVEPLSLGKITTQILRSETLVSLKIKNCSVESLEGLQTCANIQFLDASSNRINSIDSQWFKNLEFLTYLDLSDNQIENIERECILFVREKCPNLLHLRLARNRIKSLREIQNLLEIQVVDKERAPDLKKCASSLKYLDLRGNLVVEIEHYIECVAYFAPSLVLLDGAEVQEVYRRKGRFLFEGRLTTEMIEKKTKAIVSSNNRCSNNKSSSLSHVLDLSEMFVKRLDDESVSGAAMVAAKILNLDKNILADVSILGKLKHLRRLSLTKNSVRQAFVRETYCIKRRSSDSESSDKPSEDEKKYYEQFFPHLKELDVRFNRMDSRRLLKLQLHKLQFLSFVDISNNRVQNLDGLKNLRNLRKIRADENPLRPFNEHTFLGFEALESLSMKRCGIRSFAHMNILSNLESLRLDGNRTKDAALAFKQLSSVLNLKKLSLRGCKFTSPYFDNAVFALESLEILDGIEITCENREKVREDMENRRAQEEALKFQEATLKRLHVNVKISSSSSAQLTHKFPRCTLR